MAFLFKKKKTPSELAAILARDLAAFSTHASDEKAVEKLQTDVAKRINQMRDVVYGEAEKSEKGGHGGHGGGGTNSSSHADLIGDPAAIEELARAFEAHEVMPLMLGHFKSVAFEVRKTVASIFCFFVRNDVSGFGSTYLPQHTALLYQMADGYSSPDLALHCGAMLRECIKLPRLHEALLYGPDGGISKPLHDIFERYVHDPNFEVAADAFDTLTTLLVNNKALVFNCLNPEGGAAPLARYIELFVMYNRCLTSDNYVLKRQSLKLLSEFLLDRDNFRIMMRYISDKSNLKIIMQLLRHKQPAIQFEAFHVFKVFVANPEKPADIVEILAANKAKLIAFLQTFQNEKDDEQFNEEKAMLIDTLMRLPDVVLPLSSHHEQTGSLASIASTASSANSGAGAAGSAAPHSAT